MNTTKFVRMHPTFSAIEMVMMCIHSVFETVLSCQVKVAVGDSGFVALVTPFEQ